MYHQAIICHSTYMAYNRVFVQEIEYMNEHIWDKAADENQVVDFHDIMFKFTLDSFIL